MGKEDISNQNYLNAESSSVQKLSFEIQDLEIKLKHVEGTRVNNDEEEIKRLKNKFELNLALGNSYEKLGDLFGGSNKSFYAQSIKHFVNAASEAFMLGRDKEAKVYYTKAARLSRKLGDVVNAKYFMQRAMDSSRKAIKEGIDDSVRGEYIAFLLGAALLCMQPRVTGNVAGVGSGVLDFLGIGFFALLVVLGILKLYAKS